MAAKETLLCLCLIFVHVDFGFGLLCTLTKDTCPDIHEWCPECDPAICLKVNVEETTDSTGSCFLSSPSQNISTCLQEPGYLQFHVKSASVDPGDCFTIYESLSPSLCDDLSTPSSDVQMSTVFENCGFLNEIVLRSLDSGFHIRFNQTSSAEKITQFNGIAEIGYAKYRKPSVTENPECSCSEGFVRYGCSCYALFVDDGVNTWLEAEKNCSSYGGHLVKIDSEDEMRTLKDFMQTVWWDDMYVRRPMPWTFMGLDDRAQLGYFRWPDSSPASYAEWFHPAYKIHVPPLSGAKYTFQPTEDPSNQCSVLYFNYKDLYASSSWYTIPCNQRFDKISRICEVEATGKLHAAADNTTIESTSSNVTCEDGWALRDGACFMLYSVTGTKLGDIVNIPVILKLCQDAGAQIADLTSKDTGVDMLRSWRISKIYGNTLYKLNGQFTVLKPYPTVFEYTDNKCRQEYYTSDGQPSGNITFLEIPEYLPALRNIICQRPPKQVAVTCGKSQFTCDDGTCIWEIHRCSGSNECADGSDERNCTIEAEELQYRCESGESIPVTKFCDRETDCKDSSDEIDCSYSKCPDQYFSCGDRDDFCMPIKHRCNLVEECPNGMDEVGCNCTGFKCNNGKCIHKNHIRDLYSDCGSDSSEDEVLTAADIWRGYFEVKREEDAQNSQLVNLDSFCESTTESRCRIGHSKCFQRSEACVYDYGKHGEMLTCRDGSHLQHCKNYECPGMYKCPNSYCIPLRKVCDGKRDCPGGEEESNCPVHPTCPGGFHCRGERFCISQAEVCDGIIHCTFSRDDEINCDNPACPTGCICGRYISTCDDATFDLASAFPPNTRQISIRNTKRSIMSKIFASLPNLVHLTITNSSIEEIEQGSFSVPPNLRHLNLSSNNLKTIPSFKPQSKIRYLDISHNKLVNLQNTYFAGLPKLESLHLNDNELTALSPENFAKLSSLKTLDISNQNISVLQPNIFKNVHNLEVLLMNNCSLSKIDNATFVGLDHLKLLDIENNNLEEINPQVFKSLRLATLKTDTLKLCCAANHHADKCTPGFGKYAIYHSCTNLIGIYPLQLIVWILAGLAAFGNLVVLIVFCCLLRRDSTVAILIINLCFAGLLMAAYLFLIGSYNFLYADTYLMEDENWRESIPYQVAGYLCQVSVEIFIFALFLIAIERIRAVTQRYSDRKMSARAAVIVMLFAWIIIAVACALPFILPEFSIDELWVKDETRKYRYYGSVSTPFWFLGDLSIYNGVFIAVNAFFLCLTSLLFLSLCCIKSKGRSYESSYAKALFVIFLVNFICWIPIAVLQFIAMAGLFYLPTEAASWIALLVIPFNAAIDPYLYLIIWCCTRRKISKNKYEFGGEYDEKNNKSFFDPDYTSSRSRFQLGGKRLSGIENAALEDDYNTVFDAYKTTDENIYDNVTIGKPSVKIESEGDFVETGDKKFGTVRGKISSPEFVNPIYEDDKVNGQVQAATSGKSSSSGILAPIEKTSAKGTDLAGVHGSAAMSLKIPVTDLDSPSDSEVENLSDSAKTSASLSKDENGEMNTDTTMGPNTDIKFHGGIVEVSKDVAPTVHLPNINAQTNSGAPELDAPKVHGTVAPNNESPKLNVTDSTTKVQAGLPDVDASIQNESGHKDMEHLDKSVITAGIPVVPVTKEKKHKKKHKDKHHKKDKVRKPKDDIAGVHLGVGKEKINGPNADLAAPMANADVDFAVPSLEGEDLRTSPSIDANIPIADDDKPGAEVELPTAIQLAMAGDLNPEAAVNVEVAIPVESGPGINMKIDSNEGLESNTSSIPQTGTEGTDQNGEREMEMVTPAINVPEFGISDNTTDVNKNIEIPEAIDTPVRTADLEAVSGEVDLRTPTFIPVAPVMKEKKHKKKHKDKHHKKDKVRKPKDDIAVVHLGIGKEKINGPNADLAAPMATADVDFAAPSLEGEDLRSSPSIDTNIPIADDDKPGAKVELPTAIQLAMAGDLNPEAAVNVEVAAIFPESAAKVDVDVPFQPVALEVNNHIPLINSAYNDIPTASSEIGTGVTSPIAKPTINAPDSGIPDNIMDVNKSIEIPETNGAPIPTADLEVDSLPVTLPETVTEVTLPNEQPTVDMTKGEVPEDALEYGKGIYLPTLPVPLPTELSVPEEKITVPEITVDAEAKGLLPDADIDASVHLPTELSGAEEKITAPEILADTEAKGILPDADIDASVHLPTELSEAEEKITAPEISVETEAEGDLPDADVDASVHLPTQLSEAEGQIAAPEISVDTEAEGDLPDADVDASVHLPTELTEAKEKLTAPEISIDAMSEGVLEALPTQSLDVEENVATPDIATNPVAEPTDVESEAIVQVPVGDLESSATHPSENETEVAEDGAPTVDGKVDIPSTLNSNADVPSGMEDNIPSKKIDAPSVFKDALPVLAPPEEQEGGVEVPLTEFNGDPGIDSHTPIVIGDTVTPNDATVQEAGLDISDDSKNLPELDADSLPYQQNADVLATAETPKEEAAAIIPEETASLESPESSLESTDKNKDVKAYIEPIDSHAPIVIEEGVITPDDATVEEAGLDTSDIFKNLAKLDADDNFNAPETATDLKSKVGAPPIHLDTDMKSMEETPDEKAAIIIPDETVNLESPESTPGTADTGHDVQPDIKPTVHFSVPNNLNDIGGEENWASIQTDDETPAIPSEEQTNTISEEVENEIDAKDNDNPATPINPGEMENGNDVPVKLQSLEIPQPKAEIEAPTNDRASLNGNKIDTPDHLLTRENPHVEAEIEVPTNDQTSLTEGDEIAPDDKLVVKPNSSLERDQQIYEDDSDMKEDLNSEDQKDESQLEDCEEIEPRDGGKSPEGIGASNLVDNEDNDHSALSVAQLSLKHRRLEDEPHRPHLIILKKNSLGGEQTDKAGKTPRVISHEEQDAPELRSRGIKDIHFLPDSEDEEEFVTGRHRLGRGLSQRINSLKHHGHSEAEGAAGFENREIPEEPSVPEDEPEEAKPEQALAEDDVGSDLPAEDRISYTKEKLEPPPDVRSLDSVLSDSPFAVEVGPPDESQPPSPLKVITPTEDEKVASDPRENEDLIMPSTTDGLESGPPDLKSSGTNSDGDHTKLYFYGSRFGVDLE